VGKLLKGRYKKMNELKEMIKSKKEKDIRNLKLNATDFESKKDLVTREIKKSYVDVLDINNEKELIVLQGLITLFLCFNWLNIEEPDSNKYIQREKEKYERLKKDFLEMVRLMEARKSPKSGYRLTKYEAVEEPLLYPDDKPLLEEELLKLIPEYTPPNTQKKAIKNIRDFCIKCFKDVGMGDGRARENTKYIIQAIKDGIQVPQATFIGRWCFSPIDPLNEILSRDTSLIEPYLLRV